MSYQRADFTPLARSPYGAGCHWTTATVPRTGEPVPFEQAVEAFDVPAFVARAVAMGVGHVLFTATHSRHWFPGPNPEADRILPGRTCRRDLLLDLAVALNEAGILFLAYYNSGLHKGDPEWREAVGANLPDRARFFDNWCRMIGWMGEHYGPRLAGWWIDSGYEIDEHHDAPWDRLAAAAKAGYDQRLLCYNPGIEGLHAYTECQDYWSGEVCRLNYLPRGPLTPAGLPWHAFVSWYGHSPRPLCGVWVMNEATRALDWIAPPVEAVDAFVQGFRRVGGAVTFNLLCYQDGSLFEPDFAVMRALRERTAGA